MKKPVSKKTENFLIKLGQKCAANKGIERAPVPTLAQELSDLTGKTITDTVVYNWCARDSISHPLRPYVARICLREKVDLPKSLAVYVAEVPA